MPIRVANTIVKKLSKQLYYNYGKTVASRTYLLLLFSFTLISYFSLPVITKYYHNIITPTIHSNIPLSHLSTSLDAQCWHASAHVQFSNFSTSRHPPSQYLITEQIRLSHPDQPVTFGLIQHAQQIYEAISTTIVTVDDDPSPVSLASICYKHHGHCLVHAPPFAQFRDAEGWRSKTVLDHAHAQNQYETHPYSVYSNATFDHEGRFIKADAVLLTFVLRQNKNGNVIRIWNRLLQEVKSKYNVIDFETHRSYPSHSVWAAPSNTVAHTIQYKFNLFPYDISYKVQVSIVAYFIIFYLVSVSFSKSNLVKSSYSFGLAAVFLSIACYTTTWGIVDRLGITLSHVPWYLLLIAVNIGCLENIFLLTNAVLYAGCDMVVNEKISRGLQSVGVPMTATLAAELFILNVGKHMDALLIQEFCIFAQLALIVDFILQATFVVAVLSIDIKRVELTDLDDRQTSKRLHELANYEFDKKQVHHIDFCPIQETNNKQDSKSCAECKEFKTHRVLNAFMLCLILLVLSLICSKEGKHHHQHLHISSSTPLTTAVESIPVSSDPFTYQPNLNQLSDQFWSTVNPEKDVTWLHIQPVQLFVYSSDIELVQKHIDHLQHLYQVKTTGVRYNPEYRPSLFRMFILSIMKGAFKFLSSINVPVLILCLVMIGIITWMTPKWRKEWLVPLMIQCFNQSMLALIQWFRILVQLTKRVYYAYLKQPPFGSGSKEYDANGLHRGAITAQDLFNQLQYRANVKQVHVRTLTHQHAADIQDLDFNAKHNLVSCDQDGRIVLWHVNNTNPTWTARLDRLHPIRGGSFQATLNPEYHAKKKSGHHSKHQRKRRLSRPLTLSTHLSKARCVKIDQGNKWVAAGFDDGLIRIWNINTGTLMREMDIHPCMPIVEIQRENTSNTNLRRRFPINSESPTLSYSSISSSSQSDGRKADRVLALQYVGAIAEFCHPSIAEAAARCGSSDIEVSQNFIISVHKSGLLHEWNILSGECIQTIKTGHTKDITQLHVVDSKAPHRKHGVTWVFTASKDGSVKCWERRLVDNKQTAANHGRDTIGNITDEESGMQQTHWTLIYTLKLESPITSIATEVPVGGMGVVVTGCANGSVKVWSFETGEPVCTLSSGKPVLSSSSSVTSGSSSFPRDASSIGGPIRKFSRFSSHMTANTSSTISSDEDSGSDSSYSSLSYSHRGSFHSASDHKGSIQQVVVTRYCEVENGPGLCRGCDTCFGSGFLIASSCVDNKVHAWRLERPDSGHEGSCTLCTKDYHRKQYKHRKASANSSDDGSVDSLVRKSATVVGRSRKRTQHNGASPAVKKRQVPSRSLIAAFSSHESMDTLELLDIEQLAGDVNITLEPTFLGKIEQVAGHALVFCDNILAGVRRRRHHHHHSEGSKLQKSEWEVWFASLQYYDPAHYKDNEEEGSNHLKIPTEVFGLEDDLQSSRTRSKQDNEEEHYKAIQALKGTLLNLFTSSPSINQPEPVNRDHSPKYKRIHAYSSDSSDDETRKDQEEDLALEEDCLEAGENLPFSSVRRIISLDGSGLACDFGNFIKLVYLDRPSLTEKERMKKTRDAMEDFGVGHQHIIDQVVAEENEDLSTTYHGDNDSNTCSIENRGKDGCCGGTNKEKNDGKCCGGMTKQKQQERRQQRLLKKKAQIQVPAACGGANGIVECSLKNSCSRASECASNSQAIAAKASTPSFSSWL